MSSIETVTVCPLCFESVHTEKPVGVRTDCGHIWHQECFHRQQQPVTSSASSEQQHQRQLDCSSDSNGLTLNMGCLMCQQQQQPTSRHNTNNKFVDLFIRLPSATTTHHNKALVTTLEREFHTVSRRTQLSLEKEIARREFEQTWLQEERHLSGVAQQRARQRHDKALQALDSNLTGLKRQYRRKLKSMDEQQQQQQQMRGSSDSNSSLSISQFGGGIRRSLRLEDLRLQAIHSDQDSSSSGSSISDQGNEEEVYQDEAVNSRLNSSVSTSEPASDDHLLVEERTSAVAAASSELDLMDETTRPLLLQSIDSHPRSSSSVNHGNGDDEGQGSTSPRSVQGSPTARRVSRLMIQKDTIFHPEEAKPLSTAALPIATSTPPRNIRSLLKDDIFLPKSMPSISNNDGDEIARKLPALGITKAIADNNEPTKPSAQGTIPTVKERRNGKPSSCHYTNSPPAASLSAEYERRRLQAETTYYQHQAELVEWELRQAEEELEQDELDLRQREREIHQERSRLEDSFSSIQRRVEERKQEARDRQKLTAMEETFIKYKVARCKEKERVVQELEHLKRDEVHIEEREMSEKQRQETEKIRLKKELNQLFKAMNKLEHAKEVAKLAEEQSSASQSLEACVVCFEPLVNEESELGVAVPCGHTFHSACFASYEKYKRRRGSNVPCPLCNVETNLCVTIRLNRLGGSLYCPTTSSLAKHFQKEEGRWQRLMLTVGMAGEASS